MSKTEEVSDLMNRFGESATLAMARKSRELQAEGHAIINLSLGEPDFNTPDFIKEAAKEAIDQNYTRYMPVNGYQDLRETVAAKFKRDNGLHFNADQIVVSTGAKQSIVNAILATVNPGDEVLLPAPYWVSYIEMVILAGATPVLIESSIEDDYKITAEKLEKHITDKTRMVIFSSPCNPSGSVYSEEELRGWADVISKHPRILIVSDEIYEHINYTEKHFSIGTIPSVADQTITVNGVSKAFAMTGWRIGFLGAPLWIAKACTKLQGQFTSGASSIAQRAAKAAMEADPSVIDDMRKTFHSRMKIMEKMMQNIPGMVTNRPLGAFYMLPDVSSFFGKSADGVTVHTADDMAEYLLTKAHVASVSGAAFGAPECIRFSYAASEDELIEAMKRVKVALGNLK